MVLSFTMWSKQWFKLTDILYQEIIQSFNFFKTYPRVSYNKSLEISLWSMNLNIFFNEKWAFPEIIGKLPNPSWINNYKAVCRASSATQCSVWYLAQLKKDILKTGVLALLLFATLLHSVHYALHNVHCAKQTVYTVNSAELSV